MSRFTQLALPLGAVVTSHEPTAPAVKPLDPAWRFERPGFRTWLQRLWDRGYVHGSELLDDMVYAAQGYWVAESAQVDDLLNAAENAGWIVRCENAPTVSQRAFTGLQSSTKTYHGWRNSGGVTPARFHASHWYWRPNRESAEANAFLARVPS